MKVFKEKSGVCLLFWEENSYWSLKVPPEINGCSESKSEVAHSCPTLCDTMDCSLSGAFVHGIFQARVLEWIAISFSRGSSRPRNLTAVACIAGRRFTVWATRGSLGVLKDHCKNSQILELPRILIPLSGNQLIVVSLFLSLLKIILWLYNLR